MNKLFFIAGPTGVGKSTLIQSFENCYTYIEDVSQNLQIQNLLIGKEFDAFKSQLWFIDKINDAILNWDRKSLMLFDQDPNAVVNVYSKYFLNNGDISYDEFNTIKDHLSSVEENIRDFGLEAQVILLMASPKILKRRILKRDKKTIINNWHQEIHELFCDYYENQKNIMINTDDLSKTDVYKRVSICLNN